MSVHYYETLLTEKNAIPRRERFVIRKDKIHTPAEGIGINITLDHQATGEYPRNRKNWLRLLEQLSFLSPAWLCVTLPAEDIIDKRGTFIKNAPVLKNLDYICRWAEKNHTDILLMFPKTGFSHLRFRIPGSHSPAPSDLKEYALLIVSVMEYLVRDKKYGRIKYLTIFGEPFNEDGGDFSFATPEEINPYKHYAEMHAIVRKTLDGHRLRGIGLVGPNSSDIYSYEETMRRSREKKVKLLAPLSAIDLHAYRMRLDYLPPSSHIFTLPLSRYIKEYLQPIAKDMRKRRKPIFITELGCMYYGKSRYGDNRGPSRHEAFIAEAELILRGLNLGIDGFLKWVYIFNIAEQRGHYHVIERSGNGYLWKDSFYGYAALCRHFPRGARILRTVQKDTSASTCAAVIETRNKDITVFIINDHPSDIRDVEIAIDGITKKKTFHTWNVDTWDKYKNKGTVKMENGVLHVRTTPLSLTVLTTMTQTDSTV